MAVTVAEAKRLVVECISSYLEMDGGEYCIPQNKQRPIFLEGPAGIGKTELVKQIAEEMGLGCIQYNLTHLTRQAASGLPEIVNRRCGADEADHTMDYKATEYTMSEIVDSVHMAISKGQKQGLLFVDEINCVSETLSAVMLQFLQNKSFGNHKIPEGWIIITAGNPQEYNKSARSFDAVTNDRLRVIHIDPDVETWLEFAVLNGVHPIVREYVDNNRGNFYRFDKKGKMIEIVTARGWEDLSNAIKANERLGYAVDEALVSQFIQNEIVARSFINYYLIYKEILKKEELEEILEGTHTDVYNARFTECDYQTKWALITVILSKVLTQAEKLVKMWKQKSEDYGMLEKAMQNWNQQVTNSLVFLQETFGLHEEMEHYISMLMRNRQSGYLLALKRNDLFQYIYYQMNDKENSREQLEREIRGLSD